jgi:HK97 family phage major capsid protein
MRSIKHMREDSAALDREELTLRTEAKAAYDKARSEKRALAEAEKSRDDAIKTRLGEIDGERAALAGEIENESARAKLEAASASFKREVPVVESLRFAAESDPKRGYASFGAFALDVMSAGPGLDGILRNEKLMAAAGTGMTQGVTAEGGILIPPAFSSEIWDGARKPSESMLGYCDVRSIDPGVQSVTFPGINETDRATGSRWGGVRGYWKSELTAMNESRPKFRDVKIEPQELCVLGYISDKLLRHAPGAASQLLMKAAADEINFLIGDSIVNGDGAGKPVGFVGHAATVSVSKETGQAAATITKANIDKMWSRCHANWRSGAVWFVNQSAEVALEELAVSVGTGGVPVYLPAGGVADTPNARLKGRPVVPIEYCAALGTVGDIVLANLGAYCVGTRGMVDQASSMHLKFDYAQTAFRFIFEVDGQPWLASTLTPYKDTTKTLSPIVTLATRA